MSRRLALVSRRGPGRPSAGAHVGEKVRDYPQLSIRLPGEAKAKLVALSVVKSQPQWRVVLESIECLMRSLSEPDQRRIEQLVSRSSGDQKHRRRRG
jgi:hypothetical protein